MNNLSQIKDYILKKTLENAERASGRLPVATDKDGRFTYGKIEDWRAGFWPGILNYCYLMSGDDRYLEYAESYHTAFVDRLYNKKETLDHDIGFLYIPTEYARYKIKGCSDSLKATIDAADSLLERYNEKGKYIVAWNVWENRGEFGKNNVRRMIIDCMMNLGILFEASELTGDNKYFEAAKNHGLTCMKTIVRPDFTTFHTYLFDMETGKPDKGETWQGHSDSSCWSRGQAWAVAGFTMAYRYTNEKAFLDTAIATADKFISFLDDNYLPAWDFVFRNTGAVPDASASGIAACGLLELSEYVTESKALFYKESAKKLIDSLWNNCILCNDENFEALVNRCTGFYDQDIDVDAGIIYGDYYFVKAIAKLCGAEWII